MKNGSGADRLVIQAKKFAPRISMATDSMA